MNFIGQERARQLVDLKIKSYNKSQDFPPAFGIFGASGSGKTKLANEIIVEAELKQNSIQINATSLKSIDDLQSVLFATSGPQGLIIDEAHMLNDKISNALLSCLEPPHEFTSTLSRRCILSGKIYSKGDVVKFKIPYTLIVFTSNHPDQIDKALMGRITCIYLDQYSNQEVKDIAQDYLKSKNTTLDPVLIDKLIKISRNIRTLKKILDIAIDCTAINNQADFNKIKSMLGVDDFGIMNIERKYLKTLTRSDAVGIQAISAKLGLNKEYIMEHIEPFLLDLNFIELSSSGRILTSKGKEYAEKLLV